MRVGIFGAGAIGTYVGGQLSAAGDDVVLVGRGEPPSREELRLTRLDGASVPLGALRFTSDPAELRDVELVLVCVKSGDTGAAAESLRTALGADASVVSLQNGLRNVPALESGVGRRVVPGMVTFNVLRDGAHFRQATSGPLLFGPGELRDVARVQHLVASFRRVGEEADVRRDILGVQVTKLLLNLNNGLCAATGLPIASALRQRVFRRSLAACIREGVRVARAAGLPMARIGPLSPSLVAFVLSLPDALFQRLARSMLAIDPAARSSTLQDVDRGRRTEIDYLNGEIARLAEEHGTVAPFNAWVTRTVHAIEATQPPKFVSPEDVAHAFAALV